MLNLSFRQKILLLVILGISISQFVAMFAVLKETERAVHESIVKDLEIAEGVFARLFEQRFVQLSGSVEVLADDFGFRAAVSSEDNATIVSALRNHADRAGAHLAAFISLDGELSLNTSLTQATKHDQAWQPLLDLIRQNDYVFEITGIEKQFYQVVAVPIEAPHKIGWLLMGFAIDTALAQEFKSLTGLDITVSNIGSAARDFATVSTLPFDIDTELSKLPIRGLIAANDARPLSIGDDIFLTRIKPLESRSVELYAVLQKSLALEMQPYYALESKLIRLFLAVLSIAVIASMYTAGTMLRPVRKLAAAAQQIGEGDYQTEIDLHSNDEFGQLADTLTTMQTEISQREARIFHQASHDDLTGLPNRYAAMARISAEIEAAKQDEAFSVVTLDLTKFKQINDALGHHVGDVVLQETARRLRSRLRTTDHVCRLGGDEFLLILPGLDAEASIQLIENDLLGFLAAPIELDSVTVSLNCSFGVAAHPADGDSNTTLMQRSEIAMYAAKAGGTNIAKYRTDTDKDHLRHLAIVADLPQALASEQLTLFYQPKVSLSSGLVIQAEALIRWTHPKYGFLPPDEFITVLEQTGNINLLTTWVIEQAAKQCKAWHDHGIDIGLSVNLSALDLLQPNLADSISDTLKRHRLDSKHIVLEITESAIMTDSEAGTSVLQELKQSGFVISIDDFGTGYSSLSQLKQLPVDELKIDKSFVMDLGSSREDALIVRSTVELAHGMGLKVIAEGVETKEGKELLKSMNCDVGQGYLFSKPLPADEFLEWLVEFNAIATESSVKVA